MCCKRGVGTLDLSELPIPAVVFVLVHTFIVFIVIVLVIVFVGADLPFLRRRRLARQSRLPKLHAADATPAPVPAAGTSGGASPGAILPAGAGGNPLQCSMPHCRRTGEIFWQTRHGVIWLCRGHALRFWESLSHFVQTIEHEPE